MRKLCSLTTVFLIAVLILTTSTFAFAHDNTYTTGAEFNNLSVSAAIGSYFEARSEYLLGECDVMDWAVVGIVNDEAIHFSKHIAHNITLLESTYTVQDISCYNTHADATVAETITYTQNNATATETIIHSLTLLSAGNHIIVAADAYSEVCCDFTSCSYLPPETTTYEPAVLGGSSLCILTVARGELGTTQNSNGSSKYGIWYGWPYADWCAIFVSWCAEQAVISTSVISKAADCDVMKNQFINQARLSYSPAFGGNYTPQAGDILFQGTSVSDATHVGIVDKVQNGAVWVYDGNWNDKVSYHAYSLTASNVIGYGRPAYVNSGHDLIMISVGEGYQCRNCGHRVYGTGLLAE